MSAAEERAVEAEERERAAFRLAALEPFFDDVHDLSQAVGEGIGGNLAAVNPIGRIQRRLPAVLRGTDVDLAVEAKYDASVAMKTAIPDDAYADWPGEYQPLRLPWPADSADSA